MFVIRRTSFLALGLFLTGEEFLNFQVQGAMYLNLIFSIYVGINSPWTRRIYNRIEIFNETLIAFSTYQLVFYTDFVPDQELKSDLGWMLIGSISLMCVVSMYLVLKAAAFNVWPKAVYAYLWCEWKCSKKEAKIGPYTPDVENSTEKDEEDKTARLPDVVMPDSRADVM